MSLDIGNLQKEYVRSKGWREAKKWLFVVATFGLGGLYLWYTTLIVKQGELGLRCNAKGALILLPPGRHSNFPWESYPMEPQSLTPKVVSLGPYTVITVESGFVAKTLNSGKIEIFHEGQHLLKDASHIFDSFIPVKQKIKNLETVAANTRDNVGFTLQVALRYQIENPEMVLTQVDDLEHAITKITEVTISEVINGHSLSELAPVTNKQDQPSVIEFVTKNLNAKMTEQLRLIGIKLLNIGITNWSINDKNLANDLIQSAGLVAQAVSKKVSTEREAEIIEIISAAESKATLKLAEGEAAAIKIKANAFKEVGAQLKDHPEAREMYTNSQQIENTQQYNGTLFSGKKKAPTIPRKNLMTLRAGAAKVKM